MKQVTAYLSKQSPLVLAGAAVLVAVTLYYLARKTVKDVASAAGGLVSGNNAITEGTPYEGAGVLGTLGGAINSALPFLDNVGEWIGGLGHNDVPGDNLFYIVTLPDGDRASIPSSTVAKDGTFRYPSKGGPKYVMGMQDGKRVARYAA